jgi:hypothetical protein
MALRLSTGLCTAMLGTSGIKELLDNGWIDIYTGSQPLTADLTESGTKLATISSTSGTGVADGVKLGTAGTGLLPIASTPAWSGVVAAAGVAGWFRFYGSSGTTGGLHGSTGTGIRLDGNCGISGADLTLTHTNLALASTLTITAADITQPAE